MLDSIFHPEKTQTKAGASVVIIRRAPNWKKMPIISVALTHGEDHEPGSVYPMELLALSVAIKVSEIHKLDVDFYSDCKSAIDAIRNPAKIRYWANKPNLLLLRASSGKAGRVYHVKSHPEKVHKDKSAWTRHMMGNHLADQAAIQDYTSLRLLSEYAPTHSLTFTVSESLDMFTQDECWYWVGKTGAPTLKSFMDTALEHSCTKYTTERDEHRRKRGEPPKWTGRSYRHAALCAGLKHRSQGDKARLVRILWDMVYHEGNQKKYDPDSEGLCNLCSCQIALGTGCSSAQQLIMSR
jgi:hypothetical protein